ncbi:maleylpyruvate isomerase family mycothiol-dependent enzyme [Propionicicella superfundia]|uniref:maleylpyruvate isomerase family mycothiol-dependent enzyme n=1 Tax=Propionicicella superfundia TaxID=348582 RepID=UPI0004072687|nr:maleylpyruvate isomerase family mycothiol-dependent enzyme [Propionicicella superfundia]
MDAQTQSFLTQAATFTALLTDPGDWEAASPCEQWTAADVVAHLVETERGTLESRGVLLPEPELTSDPGQAWSAHLDVLRDVLADETLTTASYEGMFGATTLADTLAEFYRFDLIVHGWDIGRAWGRPPRLTDAELDTVEALIDKTGPMLYSEGVCASPILTPDGADRQTRVLGRLGRES